MPLIVEDRGSGNRIEIPPAILKSSMGRLVLTGSNASVIVRPPRGQVVSLSLTLGENCHLAIGRDCIIGRLKIYAASSAGIEIGEGVGINGACEISLHEPSRV